MDWKNFSEKAKNWLAEFFTDLGNKLIALLFFGFVGLCIWILIKLSYNFFGFDVMNWMKDLPYVYSTFSYFFDEVSRRTQLGIYYLFSFSSIFLFPIPLEVVYAGLLKSLSFKQVYLPTVIGVITGQHINFFAGRFFGNILKPFIKRKTRKKIRKYLEKQGSLAIFFFNALPMPYPLFNFIVGLSKYSYFKWVIVQIPATFINYLLVSTVLLPLLA